MLTTADISRLKKSFITRTEFKEELKKVNEDFITRFDAVMGELKAIREELIIGNYRRSENSDLLENHEERIVRVETKLALAP